MEYFRNGVQGITELKKLATYFGLLIMWLVVRLPRSLQYSIGRFIGKLLHRFATKRRHITEVNIRLCFPELSASEQRQLVKDVFAENAIGFIEIAASWFRSAEFLQKYLTVEGLDNLLSAKAQGKGVLLVGAHYSTLDLGALFVSTVSKLDSIYRPHNNATIDKIMLKSRHRFCENMVSKRNLRGVIKSLKNGSVFWYAPDQSYGEDVSVFAPFFGVTASTVKFTAKIAKTVDCPVVILSHHRKSDDSGYIVRFSKPLDDFPSGDDVADATRINLALENEIRKYPAQYMWVHRRFKVQPEGVESFY